MNRQRSRFWTPYLIVLLIASLGCVVDNNLTNNGSAGASTATGTVDSESFSVSSGSAEPGLDNTFAVTLADTPEFSCSATSAPPMNYLQIVIGEIGEPGTIDADGRVYFNKYENGVGESIPADSGTVTVDSVDRIGGTIEGSINASGAGSSVSGSFSVEICN